MTSVPRQSPKKNDTRKYSFMSWTRAYIALFTLFPVYLTLWFLARFVRKLPDSVTRKFLQAHIAYTSTHDMDFRIPPDKSIPAYMHRWWRIARNAYMNIYYHIVLRSDDDRALHDHPWWSFSIVLEGGYFEHTISAGGVHKREWFGPGQMKFRWSGKFAHRLELDTEKRQTGYVSDGITTTDDALILETYDPLVESFELPVTTIFITGPVMRRWGFHHPDRWVDAYDWDAFMAEHGIAGMKMDGGSDAAVSTRNLI